MLALSSYKMKKYGECLFAVSKTQKRAIASNAVVININDESEPADDSVVTEQTYFDIEGNLNSRGKAFVGYLKAKCLCKMKRYSESLFTLARITGSTLDLAQLSERQCWKTTLYKGIDLYYIKQYKETVLTINSLLQRLESEQKILLEESSIQGHEPTPEEIKQHIDERNKLSKVLIQAYSYRGKANQELNDYENAITDFGKLIELGQFQDLPTEKICEYMGQISQLR